MNHSALLSERRNADSTAQVYRLALVDLFRVHRKVATASGRFNRRMGKTVDGLATNRASPAFAPQATTRDAKSGAQGDTNNHPRCTFDRRVFALELIVIFMSLKIN